MQNIQAGACACIFAFVTLAYGADEAAAHYRVYEVPGLGGGLSLFYNYDYTYGDFSPRPLNGSGQLAGTSVFGFDPNLAGSTLWSSGGIRYLPLLPHGMYDNGGSNANGVNDAGLVVGAAAYGGISKYNGQLFYHAVEWLNGAVTDLGDLGGGDSWANYVTNSGTAVGYAHNTIPDAYSYYGTQYHATIWAPGITDMGTLGGTDSEAWAGNDSGEIIGIAALDTPPVPPFNQPQTDAFLWRQGQMIDLGTLGGGFSTPTAINQNGAVTVISFDASNQLVGSYVWSNGMKTVLNGLGGDFIEATMLNDGGLAVGAASDAADTNFLAAAWMPGTQQAVSLGTAAGDTGSIALGVNNQGTIVGGSGSVTLTAAAAYAHAFIWRNGHIADLNSLIPAGSPLTLNVAYAINGSGMIAGLGTNAAGQIHAFVLMPESGSGEFAPAASAPAAPGSVVRGPMPLPHAIRH